MWNGPNICKSSCIWFICWFRAAFVANRNSRTVLFGIFMFRSCQTMCYMNGIHQILCDVKAPWPLTGEEERNQNQQNGNRIKSKSIPLETLIQSGMSKEARKKRNCVWRRVWEVLCCFFIPTFCVILYLQTFFTESFALAFDCVGIFSKPRNTSEIWIMGVYCLVTENISLYWAHSES